MLIIAWILLIGLLVIIIWQLTIRIIAKLYPRAFPTRHAGILDNPLRKRFWGPSKIIDRVGITHHHHQVLELGAGSGFYTVEAATRIALTGKLYCVDLQPGMIKLLKQRLKDTNLKNVVIITADARFLPFHNDIFDLVFLVTVIGEVPSRNQMVQELYRVIKPGGMLSITEQFLDPHYSCRRTITRSCYSVGFKLHKKFGNFFCYTLNFKKPS